MTEQMQHNDRRKMFRRKEDRKRARERKKSKSVETFFRNTLRSNLELTSLADTKASILISVNGFILTVIITASGLQAFQQNMIYAFIAMIVTSVLAILFSVMSILPRYKKEIVEKKYLDDYESALYFQDISSRAPNEYVSYVKDILKSNDATRTHMIKHLHMLGSELCKKHRWLRRAYVIFIFGLVVSVTLAVYENM